MYTSKRERWKVRKKERKKERKKGSRDVVNYVNT